ncbi:MAG: ABC transporter ATP-binding protein [Bacteroidetes bacterium]|nr:ABC transporter ATP-binding protein [Bacteroidota bacterium]
MIKETSTVIRASHLTRRFGDLTAVDDLSIEVYQGEVFGFLGPNGAGKTTSIHMICGLLAPTAGEVHIFGHRIRQQSDIKLKIGICPQENIFWPKLSCKEQLIFMGKMYGVDGKVAGKRAGRLLQVMGLEEKATTLAFKLSGGMKRRLSFCLALMHDPEIILFDEPEAGLDPQSRILVREYIRSLASEKTIILTTHNMDEADRLSDRVAIIDHGKLLQMDTPHNLKRSLGEGDTLEVQLSSEIKALNEDILVSLQKLAGLVSFHPPTLFLRAKNILEKMTEITQLLKHNNLNINEIRLRENSLEDVFINLTGRNLRS